MFCIISKFRKKKEGKKKMEKCHTLSKIKNDLNQQTTRNLLKHQYFTQGHRCIKFTVKMFIAK